MGVLIPNFRRSQTDVFNGVKTRTLLSRSGIKQGVVLSVNGSDAEGNAKLSRADGSELATAKVQVSPGKIIYISGMGPNRDKILDLKPGDTIDAEMEPMGGSGARGQSGIFHRLVEILNVTPAVPSAVLEAAASSDESTVAA